MQSHAKLDRTCSDRGDVILKNTDLKLRFSIKSIVQLICNFAVNVHQKIQYLKLAVLGASFQYDVRLPSLSLNKTVAC